MLQTIHYGTLKMPYMAYNLAAGSLARQEFPDISEPLSEVRKYLCARYEQRYSIDPYLLEHVVASVFASFKCDVHVSSRSNDGGIDIFGLDRRNKPFGVQVKRYRNKIQVDELRSFVGALMLHGQTRGVFVTTSNFTAGAPSLCSQARTIGIQLKCVDAAKLLDIIKAAQIRDFNEDEVDLLAETYASGVPSLNYGYSLHMNSL